MEVWKDGAPPRPYRVFAAAQRQGADSSATERQEEELIANDARQRGADAVIVTDAVMVVSRINEVGGRPIMARRWRRN